MKYWEILLTKQRERNKDGLTLPFLIGSQEYLPTTHIQHNIEDLILDMVSSNSFETCFRYCMGIQTFIFEIRKQKNHAFFPTYKNRTQLNLSVSSFSKGDDPTIEILITTLIKDFQDTIDKGYFSALPDIDDRKPRWGPFSEDDDIPFIQNSFKSM